MTLLLGIDPGLSRGGWALLDEHGALDSFACVETEPTGKTADNQRRLAVWLNAIGKPMRRASVVAIEFPSLGMGSRSDGDAARWRSKSMAQTAAAASAAMGLALGLGGQRRIYTPAPTTWRSRLGAPRGQDAALHAALMTRYPDIAAMRKGARPHVLDAAGLALYAKQFINPETLEIAA